jgi:hypothetical protein
VTVITKIAILPDGDESRVREIARAELGNITSAGDLSDYKIMAWEGDNCAARRPT